LLHSPNTYRGYLEVLVYMYVCMYVSRIVRPGRLTVDL
jgi:hypothetical protein